MKNSKLYTLLREPLLHFLLLGAALFLFYGLTREVVSEAPNRIVISSGQLQQLAANFKRTRMRSPTDAELKAMTESLVREEVFYREALAMGLDQDDAQVRRLMRKKLEYILEDISAQNVTDEQLTRYLQQHPDKFRSEAQVSFQQVFLSLQKRKDIAADAEKILARLNGGATPETVGDSTMLHAEYHKARQSEVARVFGEYFANAVIKLSPGGWVGPIDSEYGAHLLKISERIDANQPTLDDVRLLVEREYLAQLRKEQKKQAYQSLRKGYEITIESLKTEPVKTAQTTAGGKN